MRAEKGNMTQEWLEAVADQIVEHCQKQSSGSLQSDCCAPVVRAGMDGYEHAVDARLPRIPERWADSPELREAWIIGYITELRNRFEKQ
jgi:hypothetical protein